MAASFKFRYVLSLQQFYTSPDGSQTILHGVRVPWRGVYRPGFWLLRISGPKVDKWGSVYVWCVGWSNTSNE